MINPDFVRNNPQIVKDSQVTRGEKPSLVDEFLENDQLWLSKVNEFIFMKPLENHITNIINKMKQIISISKFNVEIICNKEYESERINSLQKFINYYKIEPSYEVWGKNVENHPYYNKFKNTMSLGEKSLAINHVAVLENNKNSNKYVLVFESDVEANYDLSHINNEINKVIDNMREYDIDFVFLGEGCFQSTHNENVLKNLGINYQKICDNLYLTYGSRCTEAYIASPKGIREFLNYFYNNDDQWTSDFTFMTFFNKTGIKSCWLIPELFKQYGYRTTLR